MNCLAAFVTFPFWILLLSLPSLYTSLFVDQELYFSFLASHPDFAYEISNVNMDFPFFNNLAIFMVTLQRYKVLPKELVYAVPFAASRFAADNSLAWDAFLDLYT